LALRGEDLSIAAASNQGSNARPDKKTNAGTQKSIGLSAPAKLDVFDRR
jgi:hypothetical protein